LSQTHVEFDIMVAQFMISSLVKIMVLKGFGHQKTGSFVSRNLVGVFGLILSELLILKLDLFIHITY